MSTVKDDEDLERSAVVIDNGTRMLRAGFGGDDEPLLEWPNLTGTPKSEEQMLALGLKDRYIGEEAQRERARLALKYPMKGGKVTDWEAMEQVWQATYQKLGADPTAFSVMMSDRPLIPPAHRELMTQTMFETFDVPRFSVMTQGVLCMFGSGRGYAMVLDCGEGATTVMPIEELTIRPHAILQGEVSGGDLTTHLQTLMTERGYDVLEPAGREALREAKESLCYVADEYDNEAVHAQDQCYHLPDGQMITLQEERVRVPEALFQPILLGKTGPGIHELVYDSIMKCDIDSRSNFYCNIIPCGGTSCFPGFIERLQKEISALIPRLRRVKVVAFPEREQMSFIGGSIIASLASFQKMWITKQEYEEHGATIVRKRCT